MRSPEELLDFVRKDSAQILILYQAGFGPGPSKKIWPEIADEAFREACQRLLVKEPLKGFYFSPPDSYDEWTLVVYKNPKEPRSRDNLLKDLEPFAQGCFSGQVEEWPQLKPLLQEVHEHLKEQDQKTTALRDAVVVAFGKQPVGCDGTLLVRVDSYNELVQAVNDLIQS